MTGSVTAGSVAAGALAAYLVLCVPLSGVLSGRELRRSPARDGTLRLTVYRRTIGRQWWLAAIALTITALAKLPFADLGLRRPRLAIPGPSGFAAEVALLLTIAVAVTKLAGRRPSGTVAVLLPRTYQERRLYIGVAVTAGVVEELLFRGFLMQYAIAVLGWSWQCAAIASALAFGVSHLYQGPITALTATLIGLGFAESYTLTASLLVPVLLHVALDLRVLSWRPEANGQKCKTPSAPSSRSPVWNTCGGEASVPSPATSNSVGAVADA